MLTTCDRDGQYSAVTTYQVTTRQRRSHQSQVRAKYDVITLSCAKKDIRLSDERHCNVLIHLDLWIRSRHEVYLYLIGILYV